jgi:flagellar basal-body rod modification protein FlgD
MFPSIATASERTGGEASVVRDTGQLGQEQFLKLMLTQLENQDPFKPLESGEFLGQLAQFGTVSGIANLERAFAGLSESLVANQALEASGLIGREVLVRSERAYLGNDANVEAAVRLDQSAGRVLVQVRDAVGQVVRQIDLGRHDAGTVRFGWNGQTDAGERAAPGHYTITAQYSDGTEMRSAETLVSAPVESVAFGPRGLTLQLGGLGATAFGAVHEIG